MIATICITLMINKTRFPWNDFDKKTLSIAKVRCEKIYPGNPCVKQFIKFGKRDYNVICGK